MKPDFFPKGAWWKRAGRTPSADKVNTLSEDTNIISMKGSFMSYLIKDTTKEERERIVVDSDSEKGMDRDPLRGKFSDAVHFVIRRNWWRKYSGR